MPPRPAPSEWPALPFAEWNETRTSLHMLTQIAGKVRLALSPSRPQWHAAPLYPTARGLSTGRMPWGTAALEIILNLVDHKIVVLASDGWIRTIPLTPARCVADLYAEVTRALADIGVEVDLWPRPQEVSDLTPLDENHADCAYDPAAVRAFFKVLTGATNVFDEWQSGFFGRSSLQFWWGSFDLSTARFTGRRTEPPADVGYITRHDLDAEHYVAGWWPGDERYPHPAFYAYCYPMPDGTTSAAVSPATAAWDPSLAEWVMRYEDARATGDVRRAVLDFLDSTWRAVETAAGWDPDTYAYQAPPPPEARENG